MPSPPPPQGLRRITFTCFAVPFALYSLTAARTVQGGDTGEFGLIGFLGGVAHPPGYPLYSLLVRLASHLPGPPFWRVSMASALCGAVASALLFRFLVRLTSSLPSGRSVPASAFAVMAFAISPLAWRLSGVPEVFSMHALACAAILFYSHRLAVGSSERTFPNALILGVVCGLAFTNHQSAIFLAPVVVWAVIEQGRNRPRAATDADMRVRIALMAGVIVVGSIAGLGPFLLLPRFAREAGADSSVWGRVDASGGLLRHILRSDYGSLSLYSGTDAHRQPLTQIARWLAQLPVQFHYLFFVAGLAGFRSLRTPRRGFWIAIAISLALSGGLFLLMFNLPDTPINREVASRFYVMPSLLFAPFVAAGLAELLARLREDVNEGPRRVRIVMVLASATLVVGGLGAWRKANWAADTSVEGLLRAEVEATKPNAIILGVSDANSFGIPWVTKVLRDRPDVRYLDVNLLSYPWYVDRMKQELPGLSLMRGNGRAPVVSIATQVGDTAPLYVIPWLVEEAEGTLQLEPTGFLRRVVPHGTSSLRLDEVAVHLETATETFGHQPPPIDDYAEMAHVAASFEWLRLALEYRKAGDSAKADRASDRAAELSPPAGP